MGLVGVLGGVGSYRDMVGESCHSTTRSRATAPLAHFIIWILGFKVYRNMVGESCHSWPLSVRRTPRSSNAGPVLRFSITPYLVQV